MDLSPRRSPSADDGGRGPRRRSRIPLWFRVEVVKRNRLTDQLVIIELIWGTRSRWAQWIAEHDTRSLEAFTLGPFVVAVGLQ
ncbi:hypothetical protein SAMN05444166_6301 [Singulisphaera sp. GP187]|nr:hypothetical protein SAMN05444166_6301 [Singulisphaera sp. GP187]